jgi:hypothetical protein
MSAVRNDFQIAKLLVETFPEIGGLAGSVNATPEGIGATEGVYSQQMFGTAHPELDRTLVGLLALEWVCRGDRAAFTECQPEATKLSEKSFEEIRALVRRVLPNDEAVIAMQVYMVINDLGKVKQVLQTLLEERGFEDVDHDVALLHLLRTTPEVAPSFQALSDDYKGIILEGLAARWNGGQGVQAEDVDALWAGVANLSARALDFYLLHLVFDVAGAAGHIKQNGSLVMTQECWLGFKLMIEALEGFKQGQDAIEVRTNYLHKRRELLGYSAEDPNWRPMTVVGCMIRGFTTEVGQQIRATFEGLPQEVRSMLGDFMGRTGLTDQGFVLYYAPAFLANLKAKWSQNWLTHGLMTLARLYHGAMTQSRGVQEAGVVKVMVDTVAALAKTDIHPDEVDFEFTAVGNDLKVAVSPRYSINLEGFDKADLRAIPGQKVGIVGIGGGSDIVQSAVVGSLLRDEGIEVAFIAEVRTPKTGSQGGNGKLGEERSLTNPLGLPIPHVYQIGTETRCPGRFSAHLVAKDFPTYTIIDQDELQTTLMNFCGLFEQLDTLILVDTGGDALYRATDANASDAAKSTPDQDLRVLCAARALSEALKVVTLEVAVGTDAPPYVQDSLTKAGAKFIPLGHYADKIMDYYEELGTGLAETTGSSFIGKTPLAFQAALKGKSGRVCLPIPYNLIMDRRNPWSPFPFVPSSGAMAGAFMMDLEQHLQAIGVLTADETSVC